MDTPGRRCVARGGRRRSRQCGQAARIVFVFVSSIGGGGGGGGGADGRGTPSVPSAALGNGQVGTGLVFSIETPRL